MYVCTIISCFPYVYTNTILYSAHCNSTFRSNRSTQTVVLTYIKMWTLLTPDTMTVGPTLLYMREPNRPACWQDNGVGQMYSLDNSGWYAPQSAIWSRKVFAEWMHCRVPRQLYWYGCRSVHRWPIPWIPCARWLNTRESHRQDSPLAGILDCSTCRDSTWTPVCGPYCRKIVKESSAESPMQKE